ncbi:MAG: c-type cytochrome domain-containing protein [Planctomycetaceae bacterium]
MQTLRSFMLGMLICTSGEVNADEDVDFSRDVRPLLNKHCLSCHSGVKEAGDLSFIRRDHVFGPRESGVRIVVPGDVDASEMIRRITTPDDAERMPPIDESPEGLTDREIETLTQWVRNGADWQDHWSFVPPGRQPLPAVSRTDWCRQRMDYFVLDGLEQEGSTLHWRQPLTVGCAAFHST